VKSQPEGRADVRCRDDAALAVVDALERAHLARQVVNVIADVE
jgi:hypothetical protein